MVCRRTEELLRAAEQARLAGEVRRPAPPARRLVRLLRRVVRPLPARAGQRPAVGYGGAGQAARRAG